jgi:hypothetical protein
MLISPYPAERVAAEAQTRLGAHLSAKGFALVASGPSGLAWRRELGGKVLAGLVCLALIALGGIGGGLPHGDPGTIIVGLACGIAAVLLFRARRSATVVVELRPVEAGCEIELRSTVAQEEVEGLLRAIANVSPEGAPERSVHDARSAYFEGRIDADEFESAIASALKHDSKV